MAVNSASPSRKTRAEPTLERKTSTSRLPLASSTTTRPTSTRVLRSNSREPHEPQMSAPNSHAESLKLSTKRGLNDYDPPASSSKRPTHWPRGRRVEAEMTTPAPARYTPLPPSTLKRSGNFESQSEQVLLAYDRTRELTRQLEVAQEQIAQLVQKNSLCGDREFSLERKILELERELRETVHRLDERELRVSKLEQDRKLVESQIEAQEQERQKSIEEASQKVEKSEAATQAALEEVKKLKELNSSLEQRVRLSTHNEARAQQVSSNSTARIQLLEEDKARLQHETEQLKSQVAQHQSDLEKIQKEKQQNLLPSSHSSDSASSREVIRNELIRQVDQFKALEQTNSRITRELAQLKTHHSNVELLKEENNQLKQRLAISDQLRQQLASTEVELSKLSQERSEWKIFVEQHQQEFTSPHEVFKALASKRIENASLKARAGSRESEIKSRDRMIRELETRLEEVEKERDEEFAEKVKAQGQAQIAERNRDLDKRRIQMLNEQLKSYTDEEKSFCDGAGYDEQKDVRISQLKELLDSHQEELARVQKEAAELRQQLQTQQSSGSPSASNATNLRSPEKRSALRTTLAEQIDRNEALESELDELADQNEMLRMEIESLQLQVHRLERDLGRGEFNSSVIQVLCPEGSPLAVEQAIRTRTLDSLRAENGALLKRVAKLEKGLRQTADEESESLIPRESLVSSCQEITRLEAEVAKQIKARERLCEMYKETTASYKRAIWEILGYSLEAVANGEFRLRSAFKDESSAVMLFVPGKSDGGRFEFKPNPNHPFLSSKMVTDLYDHWVLNHHSMPCFIAALTLDLFKLKS